VQEEHAVDHHPLPLVEKGVEALVPLVEVLRDIEAASCQLIAARTALQQSGRSALDLELARVAIAVLRLGHMPHRNACIDAVATLAKVMAGPEPLLAGDA
jgi:hypothetical protein